MKKYLLTLFVMTLLAGTACQKKVDFEKEKTAIISVIEKETNAAHQMIGDNFATLMEDWESCYVRDESYVRMWAGKNNYNVVKGWDELFDPEFLDSLRNITEPPVPGLYKIDFENYQIKVFPESAWAVYDEVLYRKEGELPRTIPSVRFLEKIDGEWKIVLQSWINAFSYEVVQPLPEETLIGTHVMNINLQPGVTMEQFIQQFSTTVLPEMNNISPQWRVNLVKGIRGTNINSYGLVHIVKSDKERDKLYNPDGSSTELGEEMNKRFGPIIEALGKYGTFTTTYTDWIVQ